MRKVASFLMVTSLVGGSFALTGCDGNSPSTDPKKVTDTIKQGADKAKEGAAELAEKAKEGADDLLAKAKEVVLKPAQELYEKAEAKIKELTAEEANATGDVKAAITEKLAKAKELLPQLNEKLSFITDASADKWESAKDEVLKLVEQLKTTLGL